MTDIVTAGFLLQSGSLRQRGWKTELAVWLFGGAVLTMVAITLLTVGFGTMKASMTNPLVALKHE